MTLKRILLFSLVLVAGFSARSQTSSGIQSIITSMDTLRNRMPAEKLYIQFDKPYYISGDTVWMKAYVLDAAFLTASKSGVVYLELANDTNKVLLRRMMPVIAGLGSGSLVLDKTEVPEGSYTIRAYTNLMRNFGEERVFRKSFYVSSGSAESWLVNSKISLGNQAGKDNLHLNLQLSKLDKQSLGLHELELRVRDGRRVLLRDKAQTDIDGKLDLNFNLPDKVDPANISLVVADDVKGAKETKITIPLPVNRPENTDLQFMPEGGNLLAGISSVIGFKAISEDGRGVNLSGKIYNHDNQEVADFSASHKGMGSFELTPKENESYTARVSLNGINRSFLLPAVKSTGTALRVLNDPQSDSIEVIISENGSNAPLYYLTAQSRGVMCYGAIIRFNGNNIITKKVAKNLFPTGIVRFTLLTNDKQRLNERIVFVNRHDNLNISVIPSNQSYKPRDSVRLMVRVTDREGSPVQGSFSLAVTDDNLVRMDSLSTNILTSVLMTSDLKGTVEDPAHYFQGSVKSAIDLDNLLLTQGWVAYQWNDVFNPPVPKFNVEPQFVVHGTVTDVLKKPVSSTSIQLVSTKPAFAMTALTGKDGSFDFSDFPVSDSLTLFLMAKNKRNKSFNVGISIDEFNPPVFKTPAGRFMPWYVNSDTSLLKFIKAGVEKKQEQLKLSGNVLNEVTITARKIIKYSHNLNGPGESDQTIEEKDVIKVGKVTLQELLRRKLPLLQERPGYYSLEGMFVHLIIDGVDVEYLDKAKQVVPPAKDLKEYFINYDAEEIKGIEVMKSPKYQNRYFSRFMPMEAYMAGVPVSLPDYHVWIEVTTRAGKGPFVHTGTGIYVHRPIPFTGSGEFYSPKYAVKSPVVLTDLRSTIFWEPNMITDSEGKASVLFYTADRPSTYSVIIEGSDMNGNIGRRTQTLNIK